jgi:hypothetical protein
VLDRHAARNGAPGLEYDMWRGGKHGDLSTNYALKLAAFHRRNN